MDRRRSAPGSPVIDAVAYARVRLDPSAYVSGRPRAARRSVYLTAAGRAGQALRHRSDRPADRLWHVESNRAVAFTVDEQRLDASVSLASRDHRDGPEPVGVLQSG
jgi:hypothetical protein